jgi:hypothetical protein
VACPRDASRSFAGRVGKAAGVMRPAESTRDPAVAFTFTSTTVQRWPIVDRRVVHFCFIWPIPSPDGAMLAESSPEAQISEIFRPLRPFHFLTASALSCQCLPFVRRASLARPRAAISRLLRCVAPPRHLPPHLTRGHVCVGHWSPLPGFLTAPFYRVFAIPPVCDCGATHRPPAHGEGGSLRSPRYRPHPPPFGCPLPWVFCSRVCLPAGRLPEAAQKQDCQHGDALRRMTRPTLGLLSPAQSASKDSNTAKATLRVVIMIRAADCFFSVGPLAFRSKTSTGPSPPALVPHIPLRPPLSFIPRRRGTKILR